MFYTLLPLLVCCSSLHLLVSTTPVNDPCFLVPLYKDPELNYTEQEIPEECRSGMVDWPEPVGELHLISTRYGGYKLCVAKSYVASWLGEVRELTGGQNRLLALPTEDEPSCTSDIYGQTILSVTEDPEVSYGLIRFNYSIVYPENNRCNEDPCLLYIG